MWRRTSRGWSLLLVVAALIAACSGRSVDRVTGDAGAGGNTPASGAGGRSGDGAGGRNGAGRGGVGGVGGDGGGRTGVGGMSPGGMGNTAGVAGVAGVPCDPFDPDLPACSCEDTETSLDEFCPLGASACPLTLNEARVVEPLCNSDAENGIYAECENGITTLTWYVGYGENFYDLAFSTATGELVYGYASEYDEKCIELDTSAGMKPTGVNCRSCEFCMRTDTESWGGQGGEGGQDQDGRPRCTTDGDGRVSLDP